MSQKFYRTMEALALLRIGTTEHLARAIHLARAANDLPESVWWQRVGPDEIFVFDTITDDSLVAQLQTGKPLRIYFDAPGGNLAIAIAISRAIIAHGKVTGIVIGNCCSAANLLFAACADRQASPSAEFTIHSTSTVCSGNAARLRASADALEKLTTEFTDIFASRTGLSKSESLAWWTGEEFVMNASQATVKGLVDVVVADSPKFIRPSVANCFDDSQNQNAAIELAQEIARTLPEVKDPALLQPWLDKWRHQSAFDIPTVCALECFRVLAAMEIPDPGAIAKIFNILQPTLKNYEHRTRRNHRQHWV